MEMDIVLRTLLQHFDLKTTTKPDERWRDRGIAFAPADGGLAVVRRRQVAAEPEAGRGAGERDAGLPAAA